MKLLAHYVQAQKLTDPEIMNWRENYMGDSLFYSYRSTQYDRSSYPSSLHYHEYYELIIFLEGDIRYICEGQVYKPLCGDIILIPPGKLHMSRIDGEKTHYKRHVFYLYPDAFDMIGCGSLTEFLTRADGGISFSLSDHSTKEELFSLLQRLDKAFENREDDMEKALAIGYLIRIFYLLNRSYVNPIKEKHFLPENVLKIEQYIDTHFSEISSVSDVAKHFFYSREYVSRLFKRHLGTTVSDYIRKRKIAMSRSLIADGVPLIEVCYKTGFGNLSTFIRTFHSVTDMTPSQYRRMIAETSHEQ